MWNQLVEIKNDNTLYEKERKMADMLLGQLNTAGSKHLIGKECQYFIDRIKEKKAALQLAELLQESN